MDNIARNAMLARQHGMSYGQWKALNYNPEAVAPKKEEYLGEFATTCLNCGKVTVRKNFRTRLYCDSQCGAQYRARRRYLRQLEEKNNG